MRPNEVNSKQVTRNISIYTEKHEYSVEMYHTGWTAVYKQVLCIHKY